MDNQFPQMLYKAGGPEQLHGGSFHTLIVADAAELDAALADGWSERTDTAMQVEAERIAAKLAASTAGGQSGSSATRSEPEDNAPPTRAELEQKATELGIDFSPNIGDRKLAERIAAKLDELAAQ